MEITTEQLAEAIFKMVKQNAGIKKFKALDLQKAMMEMYPGAIDKQMVKDAIRINIDSERLVYTYFGGSYIEIPHEEAAAN
jgi:transcriptional regulator